MIPRVVGEEVPLIVDASEEVGIASGEASQDEEGGLDVRPAEDGEDASSLAAASIGAVVEGQGDMSTFREPASYDGGELRARWDARRVTCGLGCGGR